MIKRLFFAPELLISLSQGKYEVIKNETPQDGKVVRSGFDSAKRAVFIDVESPSYKEDGEAPLPIIQRLS